MENRIYIDQCKVLASTYRKRLCYSSGQMWLEDEKHNNKVKVRLSKLSKYRLAERILRLTPRLGFTLHDELFFSLSGCLFHINEKNWKQRKCIDSGQI